MNSGPIGNNRLPLEASSGLQLPVSQYNAPTTHTIFSLTRSPLVTTLASSSPALLFNTPTAALTPMYETSFALPGCDQNDKLLCTSAHMSKTGMSTIVGEGHHEPLQRATIITSVEKPLNGTVLLATLPTSNSNVGELGNNPGLLESHLLQMSPILPMTTVSIPSTSTPSIEMMDWSAQPTSKTVMFCLHLNCVKDHSNTNLIKMQYKNRFSFSRF